MSKSPQMFRSCQLGTGVRLLESDVPTAGRGLDPAQGPTACDLQVTDAKATHFEPCKPGVYVVSTSARLGDPTARITLGDDLAPCTLRALLLPVLSGVLSLALALVLAARALSRAAQQDRTTTSTGGVR